MKCNDIENKKIIEGFEITIFIENSDYLILKEKAKELNLTIDEYIEKLIREDCEKCKNMKN